MKFKFLFFLLIIVLIPGFFHFCQAQSYGLGFDSFEVIQDKRTGLDLSPDNTFCFDKNFELSFELSFLANKKIYFGYIVRLIENDKQNIDLIYDNSANNQHFKLVIGDKFAPVSFDFPGNDLFKKWNRITLKFDKEKKNIRVVYGDKSFTQPVNITDNGCFKILFGANQYKDFKSTDVPPMKIRNISILENAQLKYHWALDETDGLKALEEIQKKDGLAVNPVWIKKLHYEWQPVQMLSMQNFVKVGFDQNKGVLHFLSKDSLVSYNIAGNTIGIVKFNDQKQTLYIDNQVLFNKNKNQLFNIYIDEQQVSTFDIKNRSWDKTGITAALKKNFLHANKFYSAQDSSIYILGGYGHLAYKNNVQRYHVSSGKWENINVKDSVFTPRYLAALGTTQNGAYILGGYGSSTGQQMLNPRNWYDLLFFNTKTHRFKKIYELKTPEEDFVYGNSMIINEKDSSYYALIFPKHKFNSELQLIKGSLTKPDFKIVGSKIPYQFVDIQSYADLFFDSLSGRFVAVTTYQAENNQTKIGIYSLYAPPLESLQPIAAVEAQNYKTVWIAAGFVVLALLAFSYFKYAKKETKTEIPVAAKESEIIPITEGEPEIPVLKEIVSENKITALQSSIFLFGNLQLFDDEGNEITKQFSPLVKELFLVILLYSIRWEGISSEKLKELLWFDKPSESARNNRSVNIAKLKGILDKMKYCQVSKETGYWKIKIDYDKIHVDYTHYLAIIGNKRALNKENITELAEITKRGNFLSNVEYEWLDSFKSEISNEIVDTYLRFAATVKISDDPEFLIKLANYIFYFDPVNEEAMIIKCKALAHLGKHSLAKTTFENFAREYNRIYGEDFQKDMPEVLHS
ncbi:galactose oxidase [Dyadobacter subterraneus]|uniref:Galactose oxidase n=1 Tax=Dyadobacter subterraneus TaxID=2773304 RepID=A0ABR9WMG1_9BACT|nr:galactose oxidase [Dyadobacter subterraneus]MBE9465561.1 galactose oxidase [Dyadobacter subterraneus]